MRRRHQTSVPKPGAEGLFPTPTSTPASNQLEVTNSQTGNTAQITNSPGAVVTQIHISKDRALFRSRWYKNGRPYLVGCVIVAIVTTLVVLIDSTRPVAAKPHGERPKERKDLNAAPLSREDIEQAIKKGVGQARGVDTQAGRFAKAVTLLGDKDELVRVGAIYELERIAADSSRYHWPAVELLTQVLKKDAPRVIDAKPKPVQEPDLSQEVQTVLRVLARRSLVYENSDVLDLGSLNLHSAVLAGGHFERGFFAGTTLAASVLDRAQFDHADLRGVDFMIAQLNGVNFEQANLKGAFLDTFMR